MGSQQEADTTLAGDMTIHWACHLTIMRLDIHDPVRIVFRGNPPGKMKGDVNHQGRENELVDLILIEASDMNPQDKGNTKEVNY